MHLACSSALCGGGTNQELALHCLYECKGDIMVSKAGWVFRWNRGGGLGGGGGGGVWGGPLT